MHPVVSLVLLLVWLGLAYRSYQRGDMVLAGIFLLVGAVLTVYRLRGRRPAAQTAPTDPTRP